jgi:RNA polymerase sigma-70 factor (ECF subfamily)
MTTAERIHRARAGDQRALEDLIREYQQPIAGFVATRISDRSVIQDICQNVFVKMVLSLRSLRSPEAFRPWLFRIAENACRDHQRRERWRRRLFVPLGERARSASSLEADESARQAELQFVELQLGLDRIGARQRRLLALSTEATRSYEQLAAIDHTSVSALKSRLFRARARLRRLMSRGETDHGS